MLVVDRMLPKRERAVGHRPRWRAKGTRDTRIDYSPHSAKSMIASTGLRAGSDD